VTVLDDLERLLAEATPGPWVAELVEPPEVLVGAPFWLVTGRLPDDHEGARFVAPPVHSAEQRQFRSAENTAAIVALVNNAEALIRVARAAQKAAAGGRADLALHAALEPLLKEDM
jgi:hypothetical protein